ncbi:MAG: redox-regulated ATPase YchF [Alphaproteobacteria bacterium]
MGFNCGIVGLPNVGKSTLFNALTSTAAAAAANYPFCTIEPNTGRVPVPDERLDVIAKIAKSQKIIETQLEVIDIAGLVRGASKGEGLGNQFLGAIRGVDAILHVLRCFDDDDVTHVEGGVDPVRDAELINTELLLADLASLEKRSEGLIKRARGGDKDAKAQLALIERIKPAMEEGSAARSLPAAEEDAAALKALDLITAKPILYVCNVDEASAAGGNDHALAVASLAEKEGAGAVVVSAQIEAELSQLSAEDRADYLESLGLERPGLDRVIQAGYRLLGLRTFLTAGPKEARAWTIVAGMTAAQAAGVIHSDFQRGFICAETIAYDDYVSCGGEARAREAGKLRQEGRDYIVQDGDIILFRFNV